MKKQIILSTFEKKLTIANYSNQTIQNYLSSLSLFLEYVAGKNVNEVSDQLIQDYLYYCKTKKKYSFFYEAGYCLHPLFILKCAGKTITKIFKHKNEEAPNAAVCFIQIRSKQINKSYIKPET
jgi:hypothetical protein